jgi:hypothetical protein
LQVPKHLGKVNGEPTFGALHTVTNEYGEVRQMTLTPTKAHDQFMPALSVIPHSLRKYGHQDVELVFTDNVRGDKAELERVFPSLLSNVSPVPRSSLPVISIPSGWEIEHLRTAYQVNSWMNCLLDDLAHLSDNKGIVIGMDMEWTVDLTNGIQHPVGLIQIAYDSKIYLISVSYFYFQHLMISPCVVVSFFK